LLKRKLISKNKVRGIKVYKQETMIILASLGVQLS